MLHGVSIYGLLIGTAFAAGILLGLLIRHKAGGPSFWRGVFSDGGSPSFSRVASAFVIIITLSWVSWEIHETTPLTDVAALLRELTPFLASTLGLTYGVNKIGAAVGALKGAGNGKGPPASASQISNAPISNQPGAPAQ